MQTQFTCVFAAANIQHVAGAPHAGRAVFEVLSEQDFDRAVGEITSWQGYAATPLVSLGGSNRCRPD